MVAGSRFRQQVGRIAHTLHSASNHHFGVARYDGLVANMTAFKPEPQTLLTVVQPTELGRPAPRLPDAPELALNPPRAHFP